MNGDLLAARSGFLPIQVGIEISPVKYLGKVIWYWLRSYSMPMLI